MPAKIPTARRVHGGSHTQCPCCYIVPAHMLRNLSQQGDDLQRTQAFSSLLGSQRFRGQREMLGMMGAVALMTPAGTRRRTVYDAGRQPELPGRLVRGEGSARVKDRMINEAYDHAGTVYDFFKQVYGRTSMDDRGMRMDASVHYREDPGEPFENAFWNGSQMIYGDGDGVVFQRFTKCLEITAHELVHGITQYEAGLAYRGQAGALNESFSDVFGSLIKQWKKKQTAARADWLIGAGLLGRSVNGVALRSLKEPGTAYDDPRFGGADPQPGHMDDYVKLPNTKPGDFGGVHINSGIPNRAFYLAATGLGGRAWERAGRIWYDALCNRIRDKSTFKSAARDLIASASTLYGNRSEERRVVEAAWKEVGVL